MNPNLSADIKSQEAIIRPRRAKNDPLIGPEVVLVYIQSDLDYLMSLLPNCSIRSHDQGFFQFHQILFDQKDRLSVAGPLLGAPQAVMAMEKLIALGGRLFWILGWCGSLQKSLRTGDIVVPTSALSEEGTSQHYPIKEEHPETNSKLYNRLIKTLQNGGHGFQKGSVWTTDAPYRETLAKVRNFQKQGILAVEMEMSALITLAQYRNVDLAGLLVVSDELADLKWRPGFNTPALERGCKLACQTILKTLGLSLPD